MTDKFHTTVTLEALASWGSFHGAYIHPSLGLVSESGSSTAIAQAHIPQSTKILSIPHSLAITYSKAAASFPPELLHSVPPVSHYAILAAFLAFEHLKGTESFWYPYIASLPPVAAGCGGPLFQSAEEVEHWLGGTNLSSQTVQEIKEDWRQDWRSIRDALYMIPEWDSKAVELTWEIYLWAASMFSSRAFPDSLLSIGSASLDPTAPENSVRVNADGTLQGMRTTEEGSSKSALFPVLDILNHRPRTRITWKAEHSEIGFLCGDDLAVGSEVFNNYGPKPNQQLLLSYGFAIEGNPDDTVMLKFKPALSEAQQNIRSQQIPASEDTGIYHIHAHSCEPPQELVQLFRLLVANGWELEQLEKYPTAAVSVTNRNEISAKLQILNALLQKGRLLTELAPKDPEANDTQDQKYARVFRQGQINIILTATKKLSAEIKHLCKESKMYSVSTFEEFYPDFYNGMESCFGDEEQREASGMEEVALILGMCYLFLQMQDGKLPKELDTQIRALVGRYPMDVEGGEEDVERMQGLFEDIFPAAAEVAPEVFGSEKWTPELLGWGARVMEGESVRMFGEGKEQDFIVLA